MIQPAAPDSDDRSPGPDAEGEQVRGLYGKLVRALLFPFRLPARIRRAESLLDNHEQGLSAHQRQLDGLETGAGEASARLEHADAVHEEHLAALEELRTGLDSVLGEGCRLDQVEGAVRSLEAFRGETERRLDQLEGDLRDTNAELARLRDHVVPAGVARCNVLVDRLAEELEEVASLVERQLRGEPLPVPPAAAPAEEDLSRQLAAVQPILVERFRGSEEEIRHRLDRYLDELRRQAPVLDLGSGRGELLLLLREAGVEAAGIEGDPALAQGARRRGLEITEARLPQALETLEASSRGAVTAIHLVEHLDPASLLVMLREVRRVLRPDGLLLIECPNPHSLRVGAGLFWVDPTHRRPLPAETVQAFLEASGFVIEGVELLHPFPEEQRLGGELGEPVEGETAPMAELRGRLGELLRRVDELLNGPRDFVIRARKPQRADSP